MKRHISIFAFLLCAFAAPVALAADRIKIVHETSGVELKFGNSSAVISLSYLDLYYNNFFDDFALIAPEKDGYTVSWWTLPADDTNTQGANSKLANYTVKIADGKTLETAQMAAAKRSSAASFYGDRVVRLRYDAMPLEVTFNSNGGTGTMSSVGGKDITSEFDLPTNAFTKTGHSFANWTNAVGKVFTDGQSVKGSDFWNPTITNFSAELVAVWTANTYTVTFNENGGGTPSPVSKTVTYDSTYGNLATCERQGWQFDGWWTEADRGTKIEPTTKVTITENKTLYAHWTQKFTVTFREDSQFNDTTPKKDGVLKVESVVKGDSATPPADPVHAGYRFTGWSGNYIGVTRDENVYATYQANSYRVVFHANDGSGRTKEQPFDYGEEKALFDNPLPRMGYTLYGWATNETSTTKVYDNKQMVADLATGGTVDLYALWTPISYTVAFNSNGGEGTMDSLTPKYGESFTVPACEFTKTGCEFRFWSAEIGGVATNFEAGVVVSNLTTEASATVTFKAEWTGYYTVAFDANGGTGTMTNLTYETGVEYALPSNAFAKTGYRFYGWATSLADAVALKKPVYTNGQEVVDLAVAGGICTLFAEWTTNRYKVVFNPNASGVRETMEPQDFFYDQEKELSPNRFTRGELWSFAGWSNSVGRVFENRDRVSNLCADDGGTVELFARWASELGPLSEAMGCDNLKWESESWKVCDSEGSDGPPCVWQHGGDYWGMYGMYAHITTNGVLSFKYKLTAEVDTIRVIVGQSWEGDPVMSDAQWTFTYQEGEEWQNAVCEIPALDWDSAYIRVYRHCQTVDESGIAYVDKMTWVSEGANPEPTDADKVTISSAAVSDGKFSLSFASKAEFDYNLLTNANLLIDSWGVMTNEVGTGGTITFEPKIIEGQPQMFYKVETIKKE